MFDIFLGSLPANSTSGDSRPPEELLLVIEVPAVSVSLASIDGVLPIVLFVITIINLTLIKILYLFRNLFISNVIYNFLGIVLIPKFSFLNTIINR